MPTVIAYKSYLHTKLQCGKWDIGALARRNADFDFQRHATHAMDFKK
jgi:hypothetical protein